MTKHHPVSLDMLYYRMPPPYTYIVFYFIEIDDIRELEPYFVLLDKADLVMFCKMFAKIQHSEMNDTTDLNVLSVIGFFVK